MQFRSILYAGAVCLLMASPVSAAQSRAAAVIDDGYAGKVLRKILDTGKLKFDSSLELRLSLDEHGQLLECRATNQAEAEQACAAAKAAAPFGTPPYGMPTFVTLALWSSQGSAKAQAKRGETKAAVRQTQASASAQTGANAAYINKIRRELRNSMYIPAETKPGTYHVTALLHVNSSGQILDTSIVKSSGDSRLDRYCLQGIKRAGKIAPPPAGMGDNIELTFTLVR